MDLSKGNDHWAFLDEIEAPMWVDLELEAKLSRRDVDDEWFWTSHPIHQCSSRKLKSVLSRSGEGDTVASSDLERPRPPEVPLSVSRSRGNKYKSKKWTENCCKLFSSKQHPYKNLNEERKPKSSFLGLKKVSEKRSVHECTSTNNSKAISPEPISYSSSSVSNLNSNVDEAGAQSSSTVILVNSQQQQQNFPHVSKLEANKDSSLLAVMRISLRKSCARRPPSRVEVNNDTKRESNGSKSLSGKSSVGSSSNPGHDVKSLNVSCRMAKEITPDSKNAVKVTRAVKNKANISNVSKASTIIQVGKLRMGDKMKPFYQEAPKSKVLCPKSHSSSLPPILNGKESLTASTKGAAKAKTGVSGLKKVAASGKENARGKVAMNQGTNGRDVDARGILYEPKGMKQNALQKEDKTGLFCLKQGKISAQNKRKPTNIIQRPHFR